MFCLGNRRKHFSESFGGLLLAAAVGATAAILSDGRRREELRQTVMEMMEKSGRKMDEVRGSAGRIKQAVEKEVKKGEEENEELNPFEK